MIKIVTLLKRRPDLSVETFQQMWRERYGPRLAYAIRPRRLAMAWP